MQLALGRGRLSSGCCVQTRCWDEAGSGVEHTGVVIWGLEARMRLALG